MFALGAKARLQRGEAIFEDLLDYLSDRLEEYCREAAERANINITELLDFKTAAVKAIINHVISETGNDDALHADYGDKGGHRLRHDNFERALKLLRDLEEDVVITYCDKHADQFVLMCTKLYAIHAWEHIDGASGTYRKIDDEDEKTVVARLADIVQDDFKDVVWFVPDEEGKKKPSKKSPKRPRRVSHIRLLPKMHKAKVSCRALAVWAKRRRGGAVWSNLTSTKAVESKTKLKLNH
jgi:hypothetical protein